MSRMRWQILDELGGLVHGVLSIQKLKYSYTRIRRFMCSDCEKNIHSVINDQISGRFYVQSADAEPSSY